jgi:hypothetical protein
MMFFSFPATQDFPHNHPAAAIIILNMSIFHVLFDKIMTQNRAGVKHEIRYLRKYTLNLLSSIQRYAEKQAGYLYENSIN